MTAILIFKVVYLEKGTFWNQGVTKMWTFKPNKLAYRLFLVYKYYNCNYLQTIHNHLTNSNLNTNLTILLRKTEILSYKLSN